MFVCNYLFNFPESLEYSFNIELPMKTILKPGKFSFL
jgi:hypothetical protein